MRFNLISSAYAAIENPVLPGGVGSGGKELGGTIIGNIIGAVTSMMMLVGFVLCLFFLVTGGIAWVISGGDKSKLQAAQDRITNAIMGLIILVASWAIMLLVSQFTGITFPNIPLPSLGNSGSTTTQGASQPGSVNQPRGIMREQY